MNEMQIFNSEEFGNVRTVTIDNEPWFVGKDVAEALGYSDTKQAIRVNVEEEDKKHLTKSEFGGGTSTTSEINNNGAMVINESGLYALIFGSKLESAKRFKHWVTSEVLPALRKTGSYEMEQYSTEMKAILMHDKKLVKMEKRLDKLEYDVPLYGNEADEISAHVKRKGINIMGGKKSEAYKAKDIRAKVYRDIYSQLKREFGLYAEDDKPQSYKALKRKNIYDAHEFIDAYEAPLYLKEIIENANAQIAFGDIA